MKKNILRIFLFFIISIVSFSASFNISDLNVEAKLQKDGSMLVSEAVTYDIDEINGIYFDIDAKGYGGITSLQVFEDEGHYEDNVISYREVDPVNYEVTENNGVYRIKLFSRNNNNTRTFKFVYTLPEAIKVYDDVAQLNRKMVGQDWQQGISTVKVTIEIPVSKDYDNSNILVFGHGPLTGEVDKVENTVVYKLDDYYPGDFLEAHILMEPEIFSEFDKSRVGVTGGSYGGYMTNWIIGHTDRFKCAASQRSISNWISKFGTTDIGYYFNADQNQATPWINHDKLWWHSPLKYADKAKTPTLFIHSEEDYRCWLAEGLQMFTALKYHGVEARLCMFRGENHELSRSGKPKHRIRRLTEITNWFEKYLKQ